MPKTNEEKIYFIGHKNSPEVFLQFVFYRGKNVLSGINYVHLFTIYYIVCHYNIGIQFLIQNLYY